MRMMAISRVNHAYYIERNTKLIYLYDEIIIVIFYKIFTIVF